MRRVWVETGFALVVFAATVAIYLTFVPGCGPSETGHRTGAAWRIRFVQGLKVHVAGSLSAQEEAWVVEAIDYQLTAWELTQQRPPPTGLRQVFVYSRRRGRRGIPPLVPPRQNHRANGTIWHNEDGGLHAERGEAHVFAGGSFEVPLLFHLLHHFSFVGPGGQPTDFGHSFASWSNVDAAANVTIGLLRSGRP